MAIFKGSKPLEKGTHETAVIHPNAVIGADVRIGPRATIGEDVEIGDGCIIGSNVIINGSVKIGKNNRFFNGVLIGDQSVTCNNRYGDSLLRIGDNNIFREYVTINVAVAGVGEITTIGSDNLFQAYSSIECNCEIGSRVVIGNFTRMGRHVIVEDRAIISGLCEINTCVRIGKMVMVGGCTKVEKDIPPFVLVDGNPLQVVGTNIIGLRRNGIDPKTRDEIKKAYRFLYRSKLNISQAMAKIEQELQGVPEITYFTQFIRNSKLGIQSSINNY